MIIYRVRVLCVPPLFSFNIQSAFLFLAEIEPAAVKEAAAAAPLGWAQILFSVAGLVVLTILVTCRRRNPQPVRRARSS